jgi:hypothetical protein
MQEATPPVRSTSHVKLWLAIIGVAGAAVAIVPPAITALRASPTVSQAGGNGTAIIGSTVDSHDRIDNRISHHATTTTTNNYWSMWKAGAAAMLGGGPSARPAAPGQATPEALLQQQPTAAGLPPPAPEPKEAEPGALGTLVNNASLLDSATWSPEASRVTRLLTFRLHAEGVSAEDKPGHLDATLTRDGHDVCTISLNTRTTRQAQGVRWDEAICHDTLVANQQVTYLAKVKASDMSPEVIRLESVNAVRK